MDLAIQPHTKYGAHCMENSCLYLASKEFLPLKIKQQFLNKTNKISKDEIFLLLHSENLQFDIFSIITLGTTLQISQKG